MEAVTGAKLKSKQLRGSRSEDGAKAFYILGPVMKKVTIEDSETGEKVTKLLVVAFKPIPVFRLDDTEGESVTIQDSISTSDECCAGVGNSGPVCSEPGRFYGMYVPAKDEIVLCTHDEITFFHELAHAAHHRIRPLKGGQDRPISGDCCRDVHGGSLFDVWL